MPTLYIDIDSLRPDHLGCYGYEASTSPNVDSLADDAVRFDAAYAAASPCMPSRAAVVTGRYGINNGVTTHGPRGQTLDSAGRPDPTLPERFFRERVPAISVASFPRHPAPWFYHVWDEYYHPREPPGPDESFQSVRGETVADAAIDALNERADDDFFLYVQFWDPHGPYQRADEEVEQFRDGPTPPYPTEEHIREHLTWDAWRGAASPGLAEEALKYIDADRIENREVLKELLAHYDAEIRYVDRHVGRLLDALRETGRYDETLVVLTADHGEEFGEHGVYREHWSTHEGTQRVPLLVKPPTTADNEGGVREELVTNVDLAPTVADYADLEAAPAWQGASLRPLVAGTNADWRDRIVVDHGLYTAQRAVRTARWKFVRTYHPGEWNDVVPDRQLFDVQADPYEQHDHSDERPAVVDALEREMAVWAERHVGPSEDALHETAREGPFGLTNSGHDS